jgi:hypothetical protein
LVNFWSSRPFVVLEGYNVDPQSTQDIVTKPVRLTDFWEAVLRGESDAIRLNGVEKWVGGCHISSSAGTGFRWDEESLNFCAL